MDLNSPSTPGIEEKRDIAVDLDKASVDDDESSGSGSESMVSESDGEAVRGQGEKVHNHDHAEERHDIDSVSGNSDENVTEDHEDDTLPTWVCENCTCSNSEVNECEACGMPHMDASDPQTLIKRLSSLECPELAGVLAPGMRHYLYMRAQEQEREDEEDYASVKTHQRSEAHIPQIAPIRRFLPTARRPRSLSSRADDTSHGAAISLGTQTHEELGYPDGAGALGSRRLPLALPVTGYVYEHECEKHRQHGSLQDMHPERPTRTRVIHSRLRKQGLLQRFKDIKARPATVHELERIHTRELVSLVQSTAKISQHKSLTMPRHADTYACQDTARSALLSAGSVVDLAERVARGECQNAIANVRPPGHHAESHECQGFCFFNNVAVAARAAQKLHGIDRVLILDWDVHHGNATEHQFADDPTVLYISLHRYDGGEFYPGTGHPKSTGRGDGLGYNVNIGWEVRGSGPGDAEYLAAMHHLILPIGHAFKPDLVFISAGFDSARGDPLGGCNVTPAGFAHMTAMLSALARGRMVMCLEGGYNLKSISQSMEACARVLLGDGPLPPLARMHQPRHSLMRDIALAMHIHAKHWKCLSPFKRLRLDDKTPDDILELQRLRKLERQLQMKLKRKRRELREQETAHRQQREQDAELLGKSRQEVIALKALIQPPVVSRWVRRRTQSYNRPFIQGLSGTQSDSGNLSPFTWRNTLKTGDIATSSNPPTGTNAMELGVHVGDRQSSWIAELDTSFGPLDETFSAAHGSLFRSRYFHRATSPLQP